MVELGRRHPNSLYCSLARKNYTQQCLGPHAHKLRSNANARRLLGAEMPQDKDGVSFLPTLLERHEDQQYHEWVIYASRLGPALVPADGWKLRYINSTDSFQLYHLPNDYREENDISAEHSDIVTRLSGRMLNACDGDYRNGTPGAHLAVYPDF